MTRFVRRLVVGLGNPGPKYADTRHNVGFAVLDHLALHEGLLFEGTRSLEGYEGPQNSSCARLFDPDALLVKPETFMNLSGEAVKPLFDWAGIAAADLLCVYDDMDLSVADLRIRPHGGAGGHNGLSSIIDCLGTDRFPRLRVGIGKSSTEAARHVLARFAPEEREEIDRSVAEATEAILFWLRSGDLEGCMTRFHSRWKLGTRGEGPEARTTEDRRTSE